MDRKREYSYARVRDRELPGHIDSEDDFGGDDGCGCGCGGGCGREEAVASESEHDANDGDEDADEDAGPSLWAKDEIEDKFSSRSQTQEGHRRWSNQHWT